jgi:hypothetical protein
MIRAAVDGTATILPATGTAQVTVPAKIKLNRVSPSQLPWGQTVRISGRILGGYIPASSKLLRLDIGVNGLTAIQGIPDVTQDGRFSVTYTFNPGHGVVRYWFRVSTLAEADFAYAPGRSNREYVTVGLPTPNQQPTMHARRHVRRRHPAHHRHRHRRKR